MDGNEYGYVKINDITCWMRTKDRFMNGSYGAIFLQAQLLDDVFTKHLVV